MPKFVEVIQHLRAGGKDIWVSGPASEEQVCLLENKLELRLPPSFRSFLKVFGAISIQDVSVSGVIEDDPLSLGGGSLYGDTVRFHKEQAGPVSLLVLQTDDEAPYCFDSLAADQSGEMPVVCYQLASHSAKKIASSFEEWLKSYVLNTAV